MKKAVIVGAGFAGCTLALLLKNKRWKVTLIDKVGFIGGGCRTFFYGGHPFTYGPRHFLSPHKEAYEFLSKYVPMRNITKINYTYIEADQTFYTYPIHEEDILNMPEFNKIQQELSFLSEESEAKNFEEFWINRIGKILYEKFIKEYNKKAWLLTSNTEMDFGFEATLKKKPLESGERHEFKGWYNCYPVAKDGYNRYFDACVEGCEVLLDAQIQGFELSSCSVYMKGKKLSADILVSSISPDILMDFQYGELEYIGRDFHNIVLPVESVFPKDVYFLYFPNATESHTRVVEYKKFTLHNSNSTLIGLEIPSTNNRLYPAMKKSEVEKAQKYFNALPRNVYSLGRMGSYRYRDMDDIIMQSLEFVEKL